MLKIWKKKNIDTNKFRRFQGAYPEESADSYQWKRQNFVGGVNVFFKTFAFTDVLLRSESDF